MQRLPRSRRRRPSAPLVLALALATLGVTGLPTGAAAGAPGASGTPSVPARAADSLADSFGVVVHTAYGDTPYADTDAVISALQDLGVRHVRDDLFLDNPAEYDAISKVAAAGIDFDLISGRPGGSSTPQDYVDTITSKLPAGAVDSIEGPNEWDVSGHDDWEDELRSWQHDLYADVRATPALDGVPVLAPSIAFRANYAELGPLTGVSDLANSHAYTGGGQPGHYLSDNLAAATRMAGDSGVVVTETGYHNAVNTTDGHRPVPESIAGVYAPRLLLESYLRGVHRVYDYELIDEFDDPHRTDPEANFGLLRHDLSPKPAYTALQNLLALAADPGAASYTAQPLSYRLQNAGSDVRRVLLQRSDGTWVLVLWRDVSIFDVAHQKPKKVSAKTVTVSLGEDHPVSVYRPSDGASAVSSTDSDTVAVPLDGEVTVLTVGPADPASTDPAPDPSPGGSASMAGSAGPPSAPADLDVAVGGHYLTVTWSSAESDVSGFRLQAAGRTHDLDGDDRSLRLYRPAHRGQVRVVLRAVANGGSSPPVAVTVTLR